MLWLCIHLPRLPLEVFSRGAAYADCCTDPWAIAEARGNVQQVSLCNDTAAACGIRPGIKLGAARALAANLLVRERNPEAETLALQGIAGWAGQFSSLVSLGDSVSGSDTVLLEVQGSLKLFGTLSFLLQQVRDGVDALGYTASIAVAPTPLASQALAKVRAGVTGMRVNRIITDTEKLLPGLGRLPIQYIGIDNKTREALTGMGVETIADCLRLPRDGLLRRFGKELLLRLDRLTGRQADPQEAFTPPAKFYSRVELPAEVEEVEALLFVLQRLLHELQGFLRSRGAGVQQFDIELMHRQFMTTVSLAMLSPGRGVDKMMLLTRERLERLQLKAPVLEIAVRADTVCEFTEATVDLFGHNEEQGNLFELLERLRARLGSESIQGVYQVAEHRPEQAWRYGEPGEESDIDNGSERPLWILHAPMRLQQKRGWPMLHGRLSLQADRERIESGWWDGGDIRRDYFIAEDYRHSRYWIFRDLDDTDGHWYLHGIFE